MPRYIRQPKTLIRKLREQSDTSQGHFARQANIHRTQLSAVENGDKAGPKVRNRIAAALEAEPSQLFHVNPINPGRAAYPIFEHEENRYA